MMLANEAYKIIKGNTKIKEKRKTQRDRYRQAYRQAVRKNEVEGKKRESVREEGGGKRNGEGRSYSGAVAVVVVVIVGNV